MKHAVLILVAALGYGHVSATRYYLSDKGNDLLDGKSSSTAWRSLEKLSLSLSHLQPGDSILLERGSVFKGQLTISRSGIYLGAYGQGAKPLISGSIQLQQWTPLGKNIWRAECAGCAKQPTNLFIDGKFQSLGRYPNTGYRTVSGVSAGDNSISDTTLQFGEGYWNNAVLTVRSSRWTLDHLPITYYHDQTFQTRLPASYKIEKGFGYFIQNHLLTLDQQGEWFFNNTSKQVFLYSSQGINPNDHIIEVSIVDSGIVVNRVHHITIENLAFQFHRTTGVVVTHCQHIKLLNIDILNSGRDGLDVSSCADILVDNSLITDSNNNGVEWHNNSEGLFNNNTICRTGLHAGQGVGGNGTHIAVNITSDKPQSGKNLFQYNTIDSTGYSGIDFRTGHTQIRNNLITNFCLLKDDGAGVYTWNNTQGDNVIEGNTIHNGIGTGDGAPNSTQLFASGIYIDDRSSHILIKGNAVSHCSTAGIFLHNAKTVTVDGNTLYGNGNSFSNKERGQLYIKLDTLGQLGGDKALHLNVVQNRWNAGSNGSYCIYLSADKEQDLRELGTFSQNQYSAGRAFQAVGQTYRQLGLCLAPQEFTLDGWKRNTRNENGSSFTKLSNDNDIRTIGKNMVRNGTMNDTEGWVVWPDGSTLTQEMVKVIDGPALKIDVPAKGEVLLYHTGFAVTSGKLYRLTFSAMSLQPGKIEFVPLMADAPWQALGEYTCFAIDSTYKTFDFIFQADKSCSAARVNFKSNAAFWIDSVSLYEIVTQKTLATASAIQAHR